MTNRAPIALGVLSSRAAMPKMPARSNTKDARICPATTKLSMVATPILGASKVVPNTNIAPSKPPSNCHGATDEILSTLLHFSPENAQTAIKTTDPTTKLTVAANTAPLPTATRSELLMIACSGITQPIKKAKKSNSAFIDIRFEIIK
jgi:hypothetical protein